jgi:alkanesulfonate monooxygenase SsuD/methylene tetrahydromethanopterin reductase-like flavin-dependent oxidoreductase (luciferase family)
MVGTVIARHEEELARKLADEESWWHGSEPEELRQRGIVVGTPDEYRDQLAEYAAAGVQRIMLQWLDLDDLEGLEALALELI